MTSAPSDPGGRPLVISFGALGDTIMETAMLRALSRVWRQPCDMVTGARWPGTVLIGLDSVGETVGLSSRKTPYWLAPDQRRLVRWLRRRRPGPTYLVDKLPKVEWLVARAGIPGDLLVRARNLPWPTDERYTAYVLRLAREIPPAALHRSRDPFPEPVPEPELTLEDGELEACRQWLSGIGWAGEPVVAIQTQSRRANRGRWPADRWVELVRHILRRVEGALALLIGTPDEEPEIDSIAAACAEPRVRNVAGDLPVRRLFALLTLCHSCVSLDTGPAHAAAALRCPVVVLAGMADPRRYRPTGPAERVELVTAIPEESWPPTAEEFGRVHRLEEITVLQVADAWERLHHRRGSGT